MMASPPGAEPAPTRSHARRARDVVALWSRIAAVVLALAGIGRLIAWGNRWYVVEQFARTADDEASWAWVYGLLHGAHEALVTGLVLLLLAGASALLSHLAGRPRRSSAV